MLSEGLGVSGILAIFMAAIFMRNYAFHSLSPIGQVTVESMIEMTCNVSENFVFAYMGLSIPLTLSTVKFELIGIGIVALLISRAVSVVFTSVIVNAFRKDKIPYSYQAIMSFSGLRGAVAFYLALNVNSEYKNLIITTTIGLIIITIVGLGSTTTCLLKAMAKYFPEDGIFHNEDAEDMMLRNERRYSGMSESLYEKNFSDPDAHIPDDRSIGVITRLERIDQDFGRKYLRKDGWNDFLEDENQDKYEFVEYKQGTPKPGKYYDNLSNYQHSIARYLEESAVNLPYEDRKSIRLSMMSERKNTRDDQGKSLYLHPNRKRQNSKASIQGRDNMSRRVEDTGYLRSTRREQMSIMSEPRMGMPRGLHRISDPESQKRVNRLDVPNVINIGNLEDISSKGSVADTKKNNESVKGRPADEEQSKIYSFKRTSPHEERKSDGPSSKTSSPDKSKNRVTFKEPDVNTIQISNLDEIASQEQSNSKEDVEKQEEKDKGGKNDDQSKPEDS